MTPPLYRTTDIYLAAFLDAEGAKLHSYRKLRPKRTEFSFLADRELHDLLRRYWNREPTLIVPFKLLAALYRLKCLAIALGRQHENYGTPSPATTQRPDSPGGAIPVQQFDTINEGATFPRDESPSDISPTR